MDPQSSQQPDQNVNISGGNLQKVTICQAGKDIYQTNVCVKFDIHASDSSIRSHRSGADNEYKRREKLLQSLKSDWINKVLRKDLYSKLLIQLGIEERRDLVYNPSEDFEENSMPTQKIFSSKIEISEIFESLGEGRTLLIVGEPGAGKTVTLMKLAESLAEASRLSPTKPLPVVLNL